MISAASRPLIHASVPVLREYGLAITRHFYRSMFAAHPELTSVFNMGNQANGTQQTSLASAVFAYAANIDNAAALAPVVERIVHKHAAVGIKPSHYPIVGRYLLGAIREVLGSAATPELLAAWDEAYWLLAGELIAAEARLYERSGREAGELAALVVTEVSRDTDEVTSFLLQTAQGASPGPFLPGQYVSVAVDFPGENLRQLRQYTLSAGTDANAWRISIKREAAWEQKPAGRVSNHLHETLQPGDTLLVSAPYGNFTPPTCRQRPLALICAGVGVTPMMSVLESLPAQGDQPVLFALAAKSASTHALRQELARARERISNLTVFLWYEELEALSDAGALGGRMILSGDMIARFREADFYLCGPLGFMREQWAALLGLGIGPERLHREVFGPEALDHLL